MTSRIGWVAAALFVAAVAVTLGLVSWDGAGQPYRTVRVERRTLEPVVQAAGRTESAVHVALAPAMFRRIESVAVAEGDDVTRGQVVVVLENDDLEAAVASAEAEVDAARARRDEVLRGPRREEIEEARARLERQQADHDLAKVTLARREEVRESGGVSQESLDEARARVGIAGAAQAEARAILARLEAGATAEERRAAEAMLRAAEGRLAEARAALEKTLVRSPVDGQVLRRHFDPGEMLTPENPEPLLDLADLSRIRVRAEIDELDIRRVREGCAARISCDSYPGKSWSGRVERIASALGRKRLRSDDPREMVDRRVLEARVVFDEPPALPLELPVDVEIRGEIARDVLAIPREAVGFVGGRARVLVPGAAGQPDPRWIETGVDDGVWIEVRAGLGEGDPVLIPERG